MEFIRNRRLEDARSLRRRSDGENMKVYRDVLEMIGRTPMVEVTNIDTGPCRLFLKLENQNPGGSIKDRIAVSMIEGAERRVYDAELGVKVAEAQYQQALRARQIHYYNVQIQEQEVALARLRLGQLESGLDIEEMRLTVERLTAQLEDARLIAPFDGQVLSVGIGEGRAVEAYRAVMVVADPSELEVSAELEATRLQDLVEGMAAAVTIANRPGSEFGGYIRRLPYPYGGGGRITAAEEEDKSTRVSLETPAAESGLELGDMVRVTVVLERKDDVLWLPPQAIRTFEGREFVVVQEGEAQRRVDVKIGIESEDRVEIEEGLTEGLIVIGP